MSQENFGGLRGGIFGLWSIWAEIAYYGGKKLIFSLCSKSFLNQIPTVKWGMFSNKAFLA